MGLLAYFSKEERLRRKVEKNVARANNKFSPKDYRQAALYEVMDLAKKGDVRAIRGLLARFGVQAQPSTEDEKEKQWVFDLLCELGDAVRAPLEKALRTEQSVTWLLRLMRELYQEDEYQEQLVALLSEMDVEYERNPDRKIQIIEACADVPVSSITDALLPFLQDVNETVRFVTVEALIAHGDTRAREPLLQALCNEESIRVRNRIIEGFAANEWATTGYKGKVEGMLPDGYRMDKSGKILRAHIG